MIGVIVAIFCTVAGACVPVTVEFYGAPTPAACERAISAVEQDMAREGYTRVTAGKCGAPGEPI